MESFKKRPVLKRHYSLFFFPHIQSVFQRVWIRRKKMTEKQKHARVVVGAGVQRSSHVFIEVMFHVYTSVGEFQASGVNYRHAKRNTVRLINRSTSDQDIFH